MTSSQSPSRWRWTSLNRYACDLHDPIDCAPHGRIHRPYMVGQLWYRTGFPYLPKEMLTRAALLLTVALSGCAHVRSLDGWLSQEQERTVVAHSVQVVGTAVAFDLVLDEPCWGAVLGYALLAGWEINDYMRQDWAISIGGELADWLAPAASGLAYCILRR